jgi:hypothetical protein
VGSVLLLLFCLVLLSSLSTQDEDKEDKSTRQKSNSNTDPKKTWLHRMKTKKTKAQDRKVTATQTTKKTLVTQDEDKEDCCYFSVLSFCLLCLRPV